MVITHYGLSFVKLAVGETVVAINPAPPAGRFKSAKFGSDLSLISLRDPNYNAVDQVTFGARTPFIAAGPGEYEFGGIFVRGFATAGPGGKINTLYLLIWDEMRIVHLGALAAPELSTEIEEELGAVDILFLPLHLNGLNPKAASRLAVGLEAKMIIPTEFTSEHLKPFLKELGAENRAPLPSLTVKKKDLLAKTGEVVPILSS